MLHKLFKDKKGVALETAIIFMLVMFSFCSIIFIISYKEKVRDLFGNESMAIPYEIEQIGEDFYDACLNGTLGDFDFENEEYGGEVDTTNPSVYSLTVVDKETLKIVLEVKVNMETLKITKWCFYNPLNDNQLIKKVDDKYFDEVD